jgi:hypothetical protein
VFYVEGREIQKLHSKNGTALNSVEQGKEDERTKKLVAKCEQNLKAGSGRVNHNEKNDENDNETELRISMFLRACKFTNPRHQKLGGEELIAFDIVPNPSYRPRNMNERLGFLTLFQ